MRKNLQARYEKKKDSEKKRKEKKKEHKRVDLTDTSRQKPTDAQTKPQPGKHSTENRTKKSSRNETRQAHPRGQSKETELVSLQESKKLRKKESVKSKQGETHPLTTNTRVYSYLKRINERR